MSADGMTMREALAAYMSANRFNPAYDDRWVKLGAGPLMLIFPSTKARVAAAKLHDLHHLLNGYGTDWTGEAEIAAWELAGGCGRHWPAWTLNIGAFTIGLITRPRRAFHAFVRGRRGRNLYAYRYDDALLDAPVSSVQRGLRIPPQATVPRRSDVFAFAGACAVSTFLVLLAPLSALVFAVSLYPPIPSGETWASEA